MTLELNQVAPQVKAMGQRLAQQSSQRQTLLDQARSLLHQVSTNQPDLHRRIELAEKAQQQLRFDWVGAAPTAEALAEAYPLPPTPQQVTVIASDGSQILPDRHAITLYYLINVGSIVYRHGSNTRPVTYNPRPLLFYEPDDLLDEQGRLITAGEVRVKRDLAELQVLTELAPTYTQQNQEPVITLLDGQLSLRVIDLPFHRQEAYQRQHLEMFGLLRQSGALLAGYVDRPRSTFVLALLHLASLKPEEINEKSLPHNPFRSLTDLELFNFLGPGQRSAIFAMKAKGTQKYEETGHGIHFFYLNVSAEQNLPYLARVEIPAWLATDRQAVDTLHATLVRQARLNGGYPYVLARADELAVISGEERQAVEMMLALEMRRQDLIPQISHKQQNKQVYRFSRKEGFRP